MAEDLPQALRVLLIEAGGRRTPRRRPACPASLLRTLALGDMAVLQLACAKNDQAGLTWAYVGRL